MSKLTIIWLTMTSSHCQAAKILLINSPSYSHCAEVSGVGQALADRGHQVSIVIGSTFNHRQCFHKFGNGIQPIMFTDSPHVTALEDLMGLMANVSKDLPFSKQFQPLQEFARTACHNLFYDKEAILRLKQEKFDLAVVDTVPFLYCYFAIPYKIGVPYVGISSFFDDFVSGRPFLPSITPNVVLKYTDSMTFSQRLSNAFSFLALMIVSLYVTPMDSLTDVAPELARIDLLNLASKCELYLYNYDTVLGYPVPVMPNHVFIGGITTGPAKPLPPPLDHFYRKAPDGVILVAFGSHLAKIPKHAETNLKRSFERLSANVLWRHESLKENGRIKQVRWLPQNDLLGNPKTKVFVSHCGNNGVFEALYHGVPLVCTPVVGDQFFNGVRIQNWKVGKTLPLLEATADEIFAAINTVLTDPMYRNNMKRASEMYHSQPMTPQERATFWLENLLKFGGGHLKSRASEMSAFSYLGYDLVCFSVALFVALVILSSKCILILGKVWLGKTNI